MGEANLLLQNPEFQSQSTLWFLCSTRYISDTYRSESRGYSFQTYGEKLLEFLDSVTSTGDEDPLFKFIKQFTYGEALSSLYISHSPQTIIEHCEKYYLEAEEYYYILKRNLDSRIKRIIAAHFCTSYSSYLYFIHQHSKADHWGRESISISEPLGFGVARLRCIHNSIIQTFSIGDIQRSYELSKEALNIANTYELPSFWSYADGVAYLEYQLGNFETAIEKFNEIIAKGTPTASFSALYNLFNIHIDNSRLEIASQIYEQIVQLVETFDVQPDDIQRLTRLAKAKLLKSSQRMIDKARAQEMFQQLLEEWKIGDGGFYFFSGHELFLNLIEILLYEYERELNSDVLAEIYNLLDRMDTRINYKETNPLQWVQFQIIRSKLSMIQNHITEALEILYHTIEYCEGYNYPYLKILVLKERDSLENTIKILNESATQNFELADRLKKSNIRLYLNHALGIAQKLDENVVDEIL
jgi:tetratricopeptide (TPR) repeat protein